MQLFTAQDLLKTHANIKVALHPKAVMDKATSYLHRKHHAGLSLKFQKAVTATSFQNSGECYNAVLLDGSECPILYTFFLPKV